MVSAATLSVTAITCARRAVTRHGWSRAARSSVRSTRPRPSPHLPAWVTSVPPSISDGITTWVWPRIATSTPGTWVASRRPQFSSGSSPPEPAATESGSSPVWASSTTTSQCSTVRRRSTSARAASTGDRKRRPAMFAESSRNGTAGVHRPTTPTRTPPTGRTSEGAKAGLPSASRTMFAASQGNAASLRALASASSP